MVPYLVIYYSNINYRNNLLQHVSIYLDQNSYYKSVFISIIPMNFLKLFFYVYL